MCKVFAFVCLIVAVIGGVSSTMFASDFRSENGRYSVELSRTGEGRILVAVFQHTNEVRGHFWSKTIDWEDPHPGWNSAVVSEAKALVTGEGRTVILRDRGSPQVNNGLRILGRGEKEETRLGPFANTKLTGARPRTSRNASDLYPSLRSGVSYYHTGSILDFIIDEEGVYAIWFGQTDQWLLISLKDLRERIVKDEQAIARLNERARVRAEGASRGCGLRASAFILAAGCERGAGAVGKPFSFGGAAPDKKNHDAGSERFLPVFGDAQTSIR